LPEDRPFLLYLCSSRLIAPTEATFIEHWASRLRSTSNSHLRKCGILVRPHPGNAIQWRDVDLTRFGDIAVWPRAGQGPLTQPTKADFYDSIYHSAAVIGVNTSALIESAIVGRPVHTLLAPELRDGQQGTLHFSYLVDADEGFLRVADTFEQHTAQLAEVLGSDQHADARNRRFLESFVRPHGLSIAATPLLVDAIEAAAAGPATGPRPGTALLKWLLTPLAAHAWSGYARWQRRAQSRQQQTRVRMTS
jgi:hypothetical protein